ncbi:MAG: DUF6517 family protein [Halalkalicoccus sp.]
MVNISKFIYSIDSLVYEELNYNSWIALTVNGLGRRRLLRAASAGSVVGLAGCSEGGSDASTEPADDGRTEVLTVEAAPAAIGDEALRSEGYRFERETTFELTRSVDTGDRSYSVTAINSLAEYARVLSHPAVGEQAIARVTVASTPETEVASQRVTFVENVSEQALGNGLQSGYGELVIERELADTYAIAPFDVDRSVSQFAGTATVEGTEIEIRLHVARAHHEGDILTLVAVHPQLVADTEIDRIRALLNSVRHPQSPDRATP